MDIEDLMQPLAVVENPGIDSIDPRFLEITTLVQNGDYAGAASQAMEVLEEGIYDIRIIDIYLYGLFVEQGPAVLSDIFRCLASLLTENWEAVGPAVKREKHAQTSLVWLTKQLLNKLLYEENNKGETWEQWVAETGSDQVQEIVDAAGELQRTLAGALSDASKPVTDSLTKVVNWLRGFQQVVYCDLEPEPNPETEGEYVQEETIRQSLSQEVQPESSADIMETEKGNAPVIEGSYHLMLLMRKLGAFEQLIEEGKFPRAAIVANDIHSILASFDPRLYFPKLFARYSYLLATKISELAVYEEQKETLEWHALEEYYKVDIDGFVEM